MNRRVFWLSPRIAASTAVDAQIGGLLREEGGRSIGQETRARQASHPRRLRLRNRPRRRRRQQRRPHRAPHQPRPPPAGRHRPRAKTAVSAARRERVALARVGRSGAAWHDQARANGDWDQLPYIPAAATAAAYGLSDSARAALVETVGAALKTLVMSAGVHGRARAFDQGRAPGASTTASRA